MAHISNLKTNERANVERPNLRLPEQKMKTEKIKRRNSFISKRKYENWQNCEKYGISNGQKILKFANFFKFRQFYKLKKFWKFVNFSIQKIPKNFIQKVPEISNLENQRISQNCCNCSILNIHEFSKFNNLNY